MPPRPPDRPPKSIRARGNGRLALELHDWPGVEWTVRVALINGQARVVELGYRPSRDALLRDPEAVALDPDKVTGLPLRRLASLAARFNNIGPDGRRQEPTDLWDLFKQEPPPPRPRRNAKRFADDPAAYCTAMTTWSEPIAEVVRVAYAQGRPIQQAVADAYQVGISRAEQLIATAREYHGDLPRQKRTSKDSKGKK